MTTLSLKTNVRDRYLRIRSILRIVEESRFEEAYTNTDDENRKKVIEIIEASDTGGLLRWLKGEYSDVSIQMLREKGKELKIKNYSRLSKASLLSEIENARKDCSNC